LWRITVGFILELAIHEIAVIADGVQVSVLGVAASLVVVILDGLDHEGKFLHDEIVLVTVFGIEFDSLDGLSWQDVHGAALFDGEWVNFLLEELDLNCVVVSNRGVIEALLPNCTTYDIHWV
jgi:hypothetical protein